MGRGSFCLYTDKDTYIDFLKVEGVKLKSQNLVYKN